jgi:hypothetical protein
MDKRLEIKRGRSNYEVNYYEGRDRAAYHNIINPDANKIALILMDLELSANLPMVEAVKIYLRRRESRDWLGFN